MEFKLTKKELETLVELAVMSDWVMTSNDAEEDNRKTPYVKLLKKIYKFAHENGCEKQIHFQEDTKDYYPDHDWEEEAQATKFIQEFEENTFWDELLDRLSKEAMEKRFQNDLPKDFDEQFEAYAEIYGQFEEEFESYGLNRLQIVEEKAKKKK